MRYLISVVILLLFCAIAYSQTISRTFPHHANQEIALEGFDAYPISKVKADETGRFQLEYSGVDWGMGYLKAGNEHIYILILSG